MLLEKIAGAHAEAGGSLADVAATATKVNDQARSMGMALTSCIVPAAGTPTFDLPDDEIEIGIGIHGEPGRRREKIAPVKDIAKALVDPIVADLGLSSGENVLAFVNGMGGSPLIELYIAYDAVANLLADAGITITRSLVGNYITSLEMAGFSVTLLRLDDALTALLGRTRPHRRPALGGLNPLGRAVSAHQRPPPPASLRGGGGPTTRLDSAGRPRVEVPTR